MQSKIFSFIHVVLYILREIFVNYIGYKCGLRSLLKRSKHKNITNNLKLDIQDKGYKHIEIIKNFLKASKTKKNVFLEMGPGGTLLNGLMVIKDGWNTYIGIDAFPSEVWVGYPLKLYDLYIDSLKSSNKKEMNKVLTDSIDKLGPIYYYGKGSIFNNDFNKKFRDGSIDFIYSWGVLEHIENPSAIFKKNFKLLSKNGSILHIIDTHPHTWNRFTNPYIFLTIPNTIWNLMYKNRGFINRYRYNDYILWAKEAGFKVDILKKEISQHDIKKIKPMMLKEYSNLSDKEILTERIYMKLTK